MFETDSERRPRRRTVNLSIERSLQLELPVAFLLVTCAVVIGLAAGVVPARRAAALDPVEALRAE